MKRLLTLPYIENNDSVLQGAVWLCLWSSEELTHRAHTHSFLYLVSPVKRFFFFVKFQTSCQYLNFIKKSIVASLGKICVCENRWLIFPHLPLCGADSSFPYTASTKFPLPQPPVGGSFLSPAGPCGQG